MVFGDKGHAHRLILWQDQRMDAARPYAKVDRAACLELFESNCPRYFAASEKADFEQFLDELDWPYQVIEREGRIVACGGHTLEPDGRAVSLCWGMVHQALHGQGVGTILTKARIAAAKATTGVETIRLDTGPQTKGFYERFGFKAVKVTPDGYAPGYDRYDMAMELTRLIRLREVQHRVGLGRSTIYRWMAEGRFPKPVRLGGHAVVWAETDVDDWIAFRQR